ncbi:hypothetical protein IZ6_22690 [Terrihabitans soli]|uniref:Uncharacterized protein n=1 Tax=Terrihabitans soli TaxID=708113 RepID=A0A6S6QM66_9HYPH|nr:hypothetical protein [Terrihabitans soli]BCJ91534.1 hypothetical protein IZ6_22690 [Terrihabitans soli]
MGQQLKLIKTIDILPDANGVPPGSNERMAALLADLERAWGGADRDLGVRAATCIRELIQQKEQAMSLMLESSSLLKDALTRLHALRALI